MAKLTRVEETNGAEAALPYEELPDRSRRITLSDGITAVFRTITVKDIRELRQGGITDDFEVSVRLAARTCIKWGDKPGVTPVQLDDLSISDFMLIQNTLNDFLPQSQASASKTF